MLFLRIMKFSVFLLLVALHPVALLAQQTSENESHSADVNLVEANPGRPTVSTPATLSPPGYLQIETGVLGAEKSGEFSNRTGIETVLKLALTRRIELVAQTEPMVFSDLGQSTDREPGEVFAGIQMVLHKGEGSQPTLSVGYFRRLYASPAPELDIGTNRQSMLLLASFDFGKFHVDANAIATEQITDKAAVHRAQFGQTFSVSHPLARHFGISGEVWSFSQPLLVGSHAVGILLAPTYTVNRFLVLDGGFNRGLTGTSTRWEGFMGLTYLLPKRLW
ncbi:MAG TPA: hypothetical protein VKZ53_00765 [Candidatus Angelobacter sp.]|nr:hypothetical protein [Candidatus Angelobacter sp.]